MARPPGGKGYASRHAYPDLSAGSGRRQSATSSRGACWSWWSGARERRSTATATIRSSRISIPIA